VVPAAIALASCGGSIGGDSVTGVSVDDVAAEAAAVTSTPPEVFPDELDLDVEGEILPTDMEWDPVLDADYPPNEDGTLSEAGRKRKIKVCHKGRTKWVSRCALKAHLRHGDTRGKCKRPAASCPCFSAGDIQAAAGACDTAVSATCSTGDPYYLALSCDPGGSQPPGILGIYLSRTADGGYCSRDDIFGSVSQSGLSDAEFQACVNAINGSGFCF
jgi:hypothetical protein